MNLDRWVEVANNAVINRFGRPLSDVETTVLKGACQGQTYEQIAAQSRYTASYIRQDAGAKLWKLLGQALGESVSKGNVQSVLKRRYQSRDRADAIPRAVSEDIPRPILIERKARAFSSTQCDWGEAIDVSTFCGRTSELQILRRWMVQERCHSILLLGMGGIGKTALSVKLAQETQSDFERTIWRSLRNAPSLDTLLKDLVLFLSDQQDAEPSLFRLLHWLRQSRCLVILDNVEAIMQSGEQAGCYRSGYENYAELFRGLAESFHQSCLILTSREKPAEIAELEGIERSARSLQLGGSLEAALGAIAAKGLVGTAAQKRELCDRYGCNPLALKIVTSSIQTLFDGEIDPFLQLESEAIIFNGIRQLLDLQFERLSPLEQSIMYWLAVNREWTTIAELAEDIVPPVSRSQLLEALESLQWRSLIESRASRYTQQPVVMEYVTERLIEQSVTELTNTELHLLTTHALIKTTVQEYTQESQIRTILQPIAEQFSSYYGAIASAEQRIQQLIAALRSQTFKSSRYAGGNLVNLLCQLDIDLSGYDLSYLHILHARLQGTTLHRVNFNYTEFTKSTFMQTFDSILSLAFSPDGTRLATGGVDSEICVWNVEDFQQLLTCQGHDNWILSLAFSPKGELLASGAEDRTIKIWDVQTGVCCKTLQGHTNYVHSVAFSPDGKLLASGSVDRTIKLWDVRTGNCLNTLSGHRSWVENVRFQPNGQLLASSSGDRTIKLWDVTTGQCLETLTGHSGQISSIAFANRKILASASSDLTIKLWDITKAECYKTLLGHSGQIWSITFREDGQILASCSHDSTIKLWDVQTGKCIDTLLGHQSQVRSIAFRKNSSVLASGGGDQTVRFWDVSTSQCLKVVQGYSSQIWSICIASASDSEVDSERTILASGCNDRAIRLWDLTTGRCLKTLKGHSSWVRSVDFSPDGKLLASGSGDRSIKLWDTLTGECIRTFEGHHSWIRAIAFSPDGTRVASSSHDRTVRLWNLANTRNERVLDLETVWTRGIAFKPDGMLVASCFRDTQLVLWDVETGEAIRTFKGHSAQIWSIAFSPCGQTLASSSRDCTVKLWQVDTGKCLRTLEGHNQDVFSVAFSPDGSTVASSGGDTEVKVWDPSTGQLLDVFQGHHKPVQSIAYTPDGQILISGSEDGGIKIWDMTTGQCQQTLQAARPYEGMRIRGVTGFTSTEMANLKVLGATEK
jgi:WD40 repeat protein